MTNNPFLDKNFSFSDTAFTNLMRKRIYRVLLIASSYDAFLLEEDGRIDEQIFNEYVSLNLRYPPNFIIAKSLDEAHNILKEEKIDLIIEMLSSAEEETYLWARGIKTDFPDIPIIILTPFVRELSLNLMKINSSDVDYVFAWLGDSSLLLAIIKLIEDQMNAEHDILEVGVQCIILVEDSVRFYSSYLPKIYEIIFQQSKSFVSEALNEHQKMLRRRGRPKILLAKNFEEAKNLYDKYKHNLLGIISDVSYNRDGVKDVKAGLELCEIVKSEDKYMTVLLQSTDLHNEKAANKLQAGFINKNSKTLSLELENFIRQYFAFGDFVFVNPKTKREVVRAANLRDLQHKIFDIPDESFRYHVKRNHLSKWLKARALFSLADLFQQFTPEDFENVIAVKRFVFEAISHFRRSKSQGIIAEFNKNDFDSYLTFSRIGQGSLGGKARGLAFLDQMIKNNNLRDNYENVRVSIPQTVVLCTDIFDEFMEMNNLYDVAFSDKFSDEEILEHFLKGALPAQILPNLMAIIKIIRKPLAIRSSSLLEDSCYQPFAGIYSTYMIPHAEDDEKTHEMLQQAIKSVYASVYYKGSKAYMTATKNLIDDEKMAVVIQEVCGQQYDDHFYPTISGVGRSVNFYPFGYERVEDGVVNLALGLGKQIVEGGKSLRFSPANPEKAVTLSKPELAIRDTQNSFYALNLNVNNFHPSVDDSINYNRYDLLQADDDGTLKLVCSTFDYQDDRLIDGYEKRGMKLVTFAYLLKYGQYQLVKVMNDILKIGQKAMMKPVEIEFVIELNLPYKEPKQFNILQIRPIASLYDNQQVKIDEIDDSELILRSANAMGNGTIGNVADIIYVKPDCFDASMTNEMAATVSELNKKLLEENRTYILIGPGRWGSSEPWLGIPVKWSDIAGAALIVESGLKNFQVDPSQGSHFFQNLTAFGVGYFSLSPFLGDGFYNLDFLDAQHADYEDDYIRHIRFGEPITIVMDGKNMKGIVKKPCKE